MWWMVTLFSIRSAPAGELGLLDHGAMIRCLIWTLQGWCDLFLIYRILSHCSPYGAQCVHGVTFLIAMRMDQRVTSPPTLHLRVPTLLWAGSRVQMKPKEELGWQVLRLWTLQVKKKYGMATGHPRDITSDAKFIFIETWPKRWTFVLSGSSLLSLQILGVKEQTRKIGAPLHAVGHVLFSLLKLNWKLHLRWWKPADPFSQTQSTESSSISTKISFSFLRSESQILKRWAHFCTNTEPHFLQELHIYIYAVRQAWRRAGQKSYIAVFHLEM